MLCELRYLVSKYSILEVTMDKSNAGVCVCVCVCFFFFTAYSPIQ